MALLVRREDLKPLLDDPVFMAKVIDAVERVLAEQQKGEARNYSYLHMALGGGGRISVLPAVSPTLGAALRVSPAFGGTSSQSASRMILVLDGKNGGLLGLVADDDLNMIRTGAPAGVACRHLAFAGTKDVAILGSGRQARGQMLGICQALPSLERVRVFSPTRENRTAFAREMSSVLGLQVEAHDHPRDVVEGAGVIDLATNAGKPVLESSWVRPGALVISIAANQIPPDLVPRGRLIVSWRERFLEEKRAPYASFGSDKSASELGEVILGQTKARDNPDQVVIAELLGMPLWDAAIARLALDWAHDKGLGIPFEL
jgi:ornithine cyclodeaminase/alanine dehydrogenase-like protein (mu-crystallin family)